MEIFISIFLVGKKLKEKKKHIKDPNAKRKKEM